MALSEEALALRRKGVSGTDAAPLCGITTFATLTDIWARKKAPHLLSKKKFGKWVEAGERLEPIVAQWYCDIEGVEIHKPETTVCKKYPWMVGSPDFLVKGLQKGLEVKTAIEWTRSHWGTPGTDEIPEAYITQCTHYMIMHDCDFWDVVVLIGGWDLQIFKLIRDEELSRMMIDAEKEFYDRYIVGDEMPPLDSGESIHNYIKHRWPKSSPGSTVTVINSDPAQADLRKALIDLRQARFEKSGAEERESAAKNIIQSFMGNAESLDWPSQGISVSWKNNKDSLKTDWKQVAHELLPTSTLSDSEKKALLAKWQDREKGARPFRVNDELEG